MFGLDQEARAFSLKLSDGREDDFVADATPTLGKIFNRLSVASVSSQRVLLDTDKILDRRGLLFLSVGLLPNQTATLIKAEAQFLQQGRTEDERNTALGRLRQALLARHRDAFAKEAAAMLERELQEQIELKDIMGEDNG
jgi:hypothetical protein